MAEDKNPETRIEPTLEMDPKPTPEGNEAADMAEALDAELASSMTTAEDELRAEVASLKDQLLRALAEVENVRRRVEREKQDTTKYAVANFAKAVLPVADNLERALASVGAEARAADEHLQNFCVGVEMTRNELQAACERFGVKPIEAMGKRLDPNFHQAMFEVEDPSVPAGTVVQVIQTGYVIHDRLLRPAMVGVAKGGPKEAPANENPASQANPGANASNAYAKADQSDDGGKTLDTEL